MQVPRLRQGVLATGLGPQALSQGAIITGLVWGSIVASVINGHFKNAGSFALAGAFMSSVGIVHAGALQMPELNGIVGGYLIMGVALIAYPIWGKVESLSQDTSQS